MLQDTFGWPPSVADEQPVARVEWMLAVDNLMKGRGHRGGSDGDGPPAGG